MKENVEYTAEFLTMPRLKHMDFGGCNPLNRTPAKLMLAMVYIISTGLISVLMVLNLLFNKHDTVAKFVEDTQMFFGFSQMFIKYAVCVYKASTLSSLLHTVWMEFWPLDILTDSKQKEEMQVLYRLIAVATRVYKYLIMASVFAFILQASVKGNRSLIAEIWTPFPEKMKESPYFELVYSFQVLLVPTAVYFGMTQLDMLFLIMLGLVCIQFRMLKFKLLTINEFTSVDNKLIKECIYHHSLLLRFLACFETVFSAALLPTIGSSMLLSTLSMYAVAMEDAWSRKLPFCFIYLAAFFEIFCYCFAGNLVQTEGESVGQAAYECDWASVQNRDVKKGLILIILRSQRKINITAGGVMVLSMESFSNVARASFSFLTFIANMRE